MVVLFANEMLGSANYRTKFDFRMNHRARWMQQYQHLNRDRTEPLYAFSMKRALTVREKMSSVLGMAANSEGGDRERMLSKLLR